MKLTCVLIIAVLFLTAITADDSRDKQEYRAVRKSWSCVEHGDSCKTNICCAGLTCLRTHAINICLYLMPM
nr:conotoxin O1 M6.17ii [Conus magus]